MGRSGPSSPDSSDPTRAQDERTADPSILKTASLLLVIVAGALFLRFAHLDDWGLWVDEIFTVQHAGELADGDINTRSFAYALSLVGFEASGVDMSALDSEGVWTWRAAGIDEWNLRAPIALLGGVTILVLGLLAHRTFGSRTTLLLCLLMALSPWHLWMSQVGRFYMQLFLLYNAGLLLYYQATEEGLLSRAILATSAIVLAFFTTPIALMIFAVLALDVAISWVRGRPSGMRASFWIVAEIGLVLCAAAFVQTYLSRAGGVAGFVGSPQPIPVMTMGLVYMVGVPVTVIAAFGFWCMLAEDERLATLMALSALVPLVVFVGFNLWGIDTHVRYLFVSLFAWLALAAAGLEVLIESLQPRWGRLAGWMPVIAFLGTFALADYIYMTGGAGYRGPWRQAMTFVAEHRQPGELVGGDFVAHLMAQYYLEDSEVLLLPARDTFVDDGSLIEDPTWLVYRVYQPSTGDRVGALEVTGELRAYFNSRIAEPYQAINVYHYRPVPTTGD